MFFCRKRRRSGSRNRVARSFDGQKRHRQEGARDSRRKGNENMLSFKRWKSINEKSLDESVDVDIEQAYKQYVAQWTQKQEDRFVEEHQDEDWFKDKYSFVRVQEQREARCVHSKQEADRILQICGETDPHKALADVFPDLDCPKPLLEFITLRRQKAQTGTRSPFDENAFQCVGEEFAQNRTVYIPRIPPKVSNASIKGSLLGAVEVMEDVNDAENAWTIYYNDPCSTSHKGTTPFDRCAWIECSSEAVCTSLVELESLIVDREGGETTHIKLKRKLSFPNRLVPSQASFPKRIKHDLDHALDLAVALDKYQGLSNNGLGIEVLLRERAVERLVEQKGEEETSDDDEDDDKNELVKYRKMKRKLDVVIGYLRKVHMTCYYTYSQYRDIGDKAYGSMVPRLRVPMDSKAVLEKLKSEGVKEEEKAEESEKEKAEESEKEKEGDSELEWESKYLQRIDQGIEEIMGKLSDTQVAVELEQRSKDIARAEMLREDAIESFCEAETKMEGDDRFRCMLPPYKLFRAKAFVFKHIHSKHGDRIKEVEAEAMKVLMRELFKRDEAKPLTSVEQNVERGMSGQGGSGGSQLLLPLRHNNRSYTQRLHPLPRAFNSAPRYYNDPDASKEEVVALKYSRPVIDYSDL